MADQHPVDPAPAAGIPDPTTVAGVTDPAPSPLSDPATSPAPGSGRPGPTSIEDAVDPATMDLPSRWSGAAAVPDAAPRRSVWARLRDRVGGTPPAPAEPDHWATMPAVDPWADQDTPVWAEGYTTQPLRPAADMPPTRLDGAPAPTRLDAAAPYAHAASPSAAKAADVAEKAMADALAAGAKVVEAARTAAALAAARAAEQAVKAGQAAKTAKDSIGETARADQAAAAGAGTAAGAGAAAAAGTGAKAAPTMPAPGTYPPPAAGAGLPPRPSSRLPWKRSARPTAADQPRIPVQTRPAPSPSTRLGAPAKTGRPGFLTKPKPQPMPSRPAPPPWAARPAPRRGRIRRWARRMTLFTVVGLVLCCGGPLAYWQFPTARQFPVSAVLPSSFADLDLRDTAAGRRAAERLAEQLQDTGATGDAFAGIYADGRGKRVTLFGVTGWRLTPGSDVDAQLERLTDELKLKDVQTFDVGEPGAHERCGVGRLDGTSVVVCAWADHGSLATVLLTRRSLTESAKLVTQLRSTVLTPKYGF